MLASCYTKYQREWDAVVGTLAGLKCNHLFASAQTNRFANGPDWLLDIWKPTVKSGPFLFVFIVYSCGGCHQSWQRQSQQISPVFFWATFWHLSLKLKQVSPQLTPSSGCQSSRLPAIGKYPTQHYTVGPVMLVPCWVLILRWCDAQSSKSQRCYSTYQCS